MKLAIITGITGKLGEEYFNHYKKQKNVKLVGFARKNIENKYSEVEYLQSNLLDKIGVKKELTKINIMDVTEIVFIHPIGMFKFEYGQAPGKDINKDGIDDDIFASNVLTFLNVFNELKRKVKKRKGIRLTVCAFGSISDKFDIPYWESYTKSKNFLRRTIKNSISKNKKIKIRGIFVNVSTTDTGNERNLRPIANRSYWLTPKEIVNSSVGIIESGRRSWTEINIYKDNPSFDPTWYTNHENVLERWEKDMGVNNPPPKQYR